MKKTGAGDINRDKTQKSLFEKPKVFIPIVIAFAVLIVGWYGALVFFFFRDWKASGVFGDSFGALTSLVSALAFGGLIYTIILQRKDLELQRHELELTREEMKGQKKQLALQRATMERQRFENTFFELLKFLAEQTSQLKVDWRDKFHGALYTGHEVLSRSGKEIQDRLKELAGEGEGMAVDKELID